MRVGCNLLKPKTFAAPCALKFPPLSGLDLAQLQIAYCRPAPVAESGTDSGGHSPHLPIPSLYQDQLKPCRRGVFAKADGRIAWRQFRLKTAGPESGWADKRMVALRLFPNVSRS